MRASPLRSGVRDEDVADLSEGGAAVETSVGQGARRRILIWFPHLDTPPASALSQSSVQENPGAQDVILN